MVKKSLKFVVYITIFLFLWFVFEWIYGFTIIGIAIISSSYRFDFPLTFVYRLGFFISFVCSIFATNKLFKHRRVQAFLNADGETGHQAPDEKNNK